MQAQPGPRTAAGQRSLLAVITVIVAAASLWSAGRGTAQIDFFQYWSVGRLLGTGVTDLYSTEGRAGLTVVIDDTVSHGTSVRAKTAAASRGTVETYATPFLYLLFGVASTGDYDLDSGIWELIGLLAVALAVFALGVRIGFGPPVAAMAVAAVFVTSGPLASDIRTGNVNAAQVALIALWMLSRLRPRSDALDVAGGALLVFAAMLKPDVAVIAITLAAVWLIDARLRTLAMQVLGMAVAFLAFVIVSAAAWGSLAPWFGWLAALPSLDNSTEYPVAVGNYALSRLVLDTEHLDIGLPLALVLILSFLAAALAGGRRLRGTGRNARAPEVAAVFPAAPMVEREFLAIGVALAAVLLLSPLTWVHYYLLLVPVQLYLIRAQDPALEGRTTAWLRQTASAASLLLLSFTPLQLLIGGDPNTLAAGSAVAAAIVAAACLLLLAKPSLAPRRPLLTTMAVAPAEPPGMRPSVE
jgi:hypothetical protein